MGPFINLHVTNRCYTAFYQDPIFNLCIFFVFCVLGVGIGETQPQVVAILERSPLFSVFLYGWYGSVLNVLALKCPPIFVWLWQNHIFIICRWSFFGFLLNGEAIRFCVATCVPWWIWRFSWFLTRTNLQWNVREANCTTLERKNVLSQQAPPQRKSRV